MRELFTDSPCTENAGARPVSCQVTFQAQHANSQDGLSLELVSATVVGSAIFRMQGAEGWITYKGGLNQDSLCFKFFFYIGQSFLEKFEILFFAITMQFFMS